MKYMSNTFNLPPGMTVNDIEGDPEGYFMITEELLLMGDSRLIQLQSAVGGDFAGEREHTIDLKPHEARTLATGILKMLNGQLETDGREIGDPMETYRIVFNMPDTLTGGEAVAIILGQVEQPVELDIRPARVFIYPDSLTGHETGFMGEDELDLAIEVERLRTLNTELVEALEAMEEGFRKKEIRFTRERRADSDPYHPANTKMHAVLAKVRGDDLDLPPAA